MSEPEILLLAKGVNGQLALLDGRVRISKKGVLGFLTSGFKGDKEIQISSISSIQFKKAGLVNGYVQFAFMGSGEAKGGVFQAASDENTVMFNKKQQPSFEAIRDEVQRLMNAASAGGSDTATIDIPDQIKKLAELRDQGILSGEEFDMKKASLLEKM